MMNEESAFNIIKNNEIIQKILKNDENIISWLKEKAYCITRNDFYVNVYAGDNGECIYLKGYDNECGTGKFLFISAIRRFPYYRQFKFTLFVDGRFQLDKQEFISYANQDLKFRENIIKALHSRTVSCFREFYSL